MISIPQLPCPSGMTAILCHADSLTSCYMEVSNKKAQPFGLSFFVMLICLIFVVVVTIVVVAILAIVVLFHLK